MGFIVILKYIMYLEMENKTYNNLNIVLKFDVIKMKKIIRETGV